MFCVCVCLASVVVVGSTLEPGKEVLDKQATLVHVPLPRCCHGVAMVLHHVWWFTRSLVCTRSSGESFILVTTYLLLVCLLA